MDSRSTLENLLIYFWENFSVRFRRFIMPSCNLDIDFFKFLLDHKNVWGPILVRSTMFSEFGCFPPVLLRGDVWGGTLSPNANYSTSAGVKLCNTVVPPLVFQLDQVLLLFVGLQPRSLMDARLLSSPLTRCLLQYSWLTATVLLLFMRKMLE